MPGHQKPQETNLMDATLATERGEMNQNFVREACEVMLSGNGQDLHGLTQFGNSTLYFHLWGGVDHQNDCPSEHFSFNSIYFNHESDPFMVWQLSYELISLFNGAAELYEKDYRKLSIHEIVLNGEKSRHFDKVDGIGLLGRPCSVGERDRQLKKALASPPRLGLLVLATENEDVYHILKYLDAGSNWGNYYKLMETVDSHCKIRQIEVPDNKANRKRFTMTANNFSMAGFDSRHGFKDQVKGNQNPPMTLEEGYEYVTGLCKSYLVAAYPQYFK